MAATQVLIVGGGVAALEAALALRALTGGRASVELVAPEAEFTYRPLSVAEPFRLGEAWRFPLRPLAAAAGASLTRGFVTSVDEARRVVTTEEGEELPFDVLLVAAGATASEAVPGALTFRGPEDGEALAALLESALTGGARRIAFALPAAVTWVLPLYELALLTETYLTDRGVIDAEITLVTPEESPLALFGIQASEAIRELLEIRGIGLRTHTTPVAAEDGGLSVVPRETVSADRVVALPRLAGSRLDGLPYDKDGFVRTAAQGHVDGLGDVYAAGDITAFPIKQGGIAAQQADAAAEAIAVQVGAPVRPKPFKPVLRGLLLTGVFARYLRAEPGTAASTVSTQTLWWPPAKVAGRYLAPFLAEMGLDGSSPPPAAMHAVPVAVELDPREQYVCSNV